MEEKQKLLKDISNQKFTEAKTYRAYAPHEYFLRNQNETLFAKLKELIRLEGKEEYFQLGKTKIKYRYLYLGAHRYWIDGGIVMNRVEVKNIVHKDGVTMQVVKKKVT